MESEGDSVETISRKKGIESLSPGGLGDFLFKGDKLVTEPKPWFLKPKRTAEQIE